MGQLLGLLGLIAYTWGIWQFWQGFHRTNFDHSLPNRITLSVFWPLLLVANKSYRKNFQKALKG